MKKVLALLLGALLCLPVVANAQVNKEGFPIVDEPVTLTGLAMMGQYTKGDFNELRIWEVMEERTGIAFAFETTPFKQYTERLNLLFAANTLPDILFKTALSKSDVATYAAEGQLLPIDGLLNDYAPNFNALLESQSGYRNAVTMADGHIYGFPYIIEASPSTMGKAFYSAKWAEQAEVQAPDTLEDFVAFLRAFKTGDYNGNGVADEIPWGGVGIDVPVIAGAYGLMTRGARSFPWDIGPDQSLRYIPAAEEYRQILEYIALLYGEGLIDQEIFTTDLAGFTAKANQNLIGFACVQNNSWFGNVAQDVRGLPAPLTGPAGTKFWPSKQLSIQDGNTFVTSSCKYPEAVVRYFDYFYSQEGITLYFMGMEGETFYYDEAGAPQFTDLVKANPNGLNMEEALGTYVCWSGGNNPTVADDLHFGVHMVSEISVTAAQNMLPYAPAEIWPASFTYTQEENERLADLSLDIDTYAEDMEIKLITGVESFDNWDAYIDTLEKMGLAEYMSIVQAGADRYNAAE